MPSSPSLDRRLGALDAAAIIVSNVIGGGILFTPPQIAAMVPAALPFLATWVAGGALAFAGAMAYAELATLRPRAGGEYVYLREAFGPLAAFLTGWTSFIAGFSGAIATSAVVFVFYLGRFIPALGQAAAFFTVPVIPGVVTLTVSPGTLTAVAVIFGMAWIHLRGVGPGRLVGDVLAALKVTALVAFIAHRLFVGCGELCQPRAGSAGAATELVAGAHPRDVHVLGLECRLVRRRGDQGPGTQRASRAGARHRRGGADLPPAEHALPVRAAGDTAGRGQGKRARRHRGQAARARRPGTSWASCPSSASRRASAR